MAKYLKINSKKGYIEDTAAIAHEKFNRMRHVVLGCMLGDFDNNGEYFVTPEIVEELINLEKRIIESIDNIDLCESFLKLDKPITFAITFQNDKATLSLLEKMNHGANFKLNGGAYSNINEYVLSEIETSGAVDKNAVYRMWNVKAGGGQALDIFHMDPETLAKFAGITRRFKYLLSANKKLLQKEEKIEEIESTYFNKMMALIARYPKLKLVVEKEIKTQLDEKSGLLRLDKPNFMKTMNEIVADVIEDHIEVLNEDEQKKFNSDRHKVENEYNLEVTNEIDIKTEKIEHDLNVDPIVLPKIETLGEEDKKTVENLGEEFIEEEKKVEERIQDDVLTLATGKVSEENNAKETKVEGSRNLIVESIKAEKEVENKKEEADTLSDLQRAYLTAVEQGGKKDTKNTKEDASAKLEAIETIFEIQTGKKGVKTPKGLGVVTSAETTSTQTDGKKKVVGVELKETGRVLSKMIGDDTRSRIQTARQTTPKEVDTAGADETQQAEENKKKEERKNLIASVTEVGNDTKTKKAKTGPKEKPGYISKVKPGGNDNLLVGRNDGGDGDDTLGTPTETTSTRAETQTNNQDQQIPKSLMETINQNRESIMSGKFDLGGVKTEKAVDITTDNAVEVTTENPIEVTTREEVDITTDNEVEVTAGNVAG